MILNQEPHKVVPPEGELIKGHICSSIVGESWVYLSGKDMYGTTHHINHSSDLLPKHYRSHPSMRIASNMCSKGVLVSYSDQFLSTETKCTTIAQIISLK